VIRAQQKGSGIDCSGTWCPKVIAMIGKPQRTIVSRAVHIKMVRKPRGKKLERFRMRKAIAELEPLRAELARLALQIKTEVEQYEITDEFENRAADNWEPLLGIAKTAGEEWQKSALQAAQILCGQNKDRKSEFNSELLEAVEEIFAARREEKMLGAEANFFLATDELLSPSNGLNSKTYEMASWHEKGLTGHTLGKVLGEYGIEHGRDYVTTAVGGRKKMRGYWSESVEKGAANFAK